MTIQNLKINNFRYRLHAKDLPGKPDIIFRPSKVAVFVHGCFWHQHENCKDAFVPSHRFSLPKSMTGRNLWSGHRQKNPA